MPFRDRQEAGEKLAAALSRYRGENSIVLALPRGGLPVALPVARALNAGLDLLLVRKIGVPFQPELAMGAVLDGAEPVVVRNEDVIGMAGVSAARFEAAKNDALDELHRRNDVYRQGRPMADVAGKTVIVVDDGIATGATVRAALKGLKRLGPKTLVVAVPVAPGDVRRTLSQDADDIVCLENLGPVGAIGAHYIYFDQLSDADVKSLLPPAGE